MCVRRIARGVMRAVTTERRGTDAQAPSADGESVRARALQIVGALEYAGLGPPSRAWQAVWAVLKVRRR